MKKILCLLFVTIAFIVASCTQSESSSSKERIDSLNSVVEAQKAEIKALTDTIEMLQFPADQRLAKAIEHIGNGNLDDAEKLLNQIKQLFPNSKEADNCDEQLKVIADKRQAIIAEQERIKALGFKALSPVLSATIGNVKASFSGFSVGKEFVHDTYYTYGSSRWFYHTADKGNKYITCSMAITSDNSDPNIPTLALYSIDGEKLNLKDSFTIQFARWDDYGTYLGNEPDLHNDFAKVNTVNFKLGCEANEEVFTKPYIVVLKLANTQERHYDRFQNPPYWYKGDAGYPSSLTIDDFNSNYKAIKIANL